MLSPVEGETGSNINNVAWTYMETLFFFFHFPSTGSKGSDSIFFHKWSHRDGPWQIKGSGETNFPAVLF